MTARCTLRTPRASEADSPTVGVRASGDDDSVAVHPDVSDVSDSELGARRERALASVLRALPADGDDLETVLLGGDKSGEWNDWYE